MAKSLILNIFGTPVTLPDPFSRVVLQPGRPGIIVTGTPSEVIAQLGGLENIRGFLTVSEALEVNPIDAVAFGLADAQAAAEATASALPRIVFVYSPGGVAGENVYTDWATMFAAIDSIAGEKIVFLDDSIAAVSVPSGAWDVGQVTFTTTQRDVPSFLASLTMTLTQGAVLSAPTTGQYRFENIDVRNASTVAPIVADGTFPAPVVIRLRNSSISTTVAAPCVLADGSSTLVFIMMELSEGSSILGASSFSADSVGCNGTPNGAFIQIVLGDDCVVEDDSVAGDAAASVTITLRGTGVSSGVVQSNYTPDGGLPTIVPQQPGNELVVTSEAVEGDNRYPGGAASGLGMDELSNAATDVDALLRIVFFADSTSFGSIIDPGDRVVVSGVFKVNVLADLHPDYSELLFAGPSSSEFRAQTFRNIRLRITTSTQSGFGVQGNLICLEYVDIETASGASAAINTTAAPSNRFLYLGRHCRLRANPDPSLLAGAGNAYTIIMGEGAIIEENAIIGTGPLNIIRLSSSCVVKPQAGYSGTLNFLSTAFGAQHSDRLAIPAVDVTAGVAGQIHRIDTSGGPVAVTLPLSNIETRGQPIVLKKTTTDANALSATPSGGDTIEGASSTTTSKGSITLYADGEGAWHTTAVI